MEFKPEEAVFFGAVAATGIVGGFIRLWRDGRSYGIAGNLGRCLSSGVIAFGAIGYWIGDDTSDASGPYYYLAIAALIGYLSSDVQEKILNNVLNSWLKRAGLDDSGNREKKAD